MGKRTTLVSVIALVLGLAAGAAWADMIAHYPFDEGSGTTVEDVTGNGNNGTFSGAVEWVPGVMGSAIRLDSAGERVVLNELDPTAANNAMTLAAWIKWEGEDHASITHQGIFGKRQGWDPRTYVKWFWEAQPDGDLAFRNGDAAVTASGVLDAYSNEWAHVALTWDDGAVVQYINAEQVNTGTMTFRDTADATVVTVGCVSATNNETFVGSIDDARIYDTVLSLDELIRAMEGTPPDLAYGPDPRDGDMLESTFATLRWKPGGHAVSHDVYMSSDFDAVSAGAAEAFLLNTDTESVIVGAPTTFFPDGLAPGTTYYWRVDEVNDVDPNSPWIGNVWSFWLPPVTAYAPTPSDGVPYALPDSQLSWSPGFKSIIRGVYFGTDANEVANATDAIPQIETTFDPGPLDMGTTYYWRVDEFDGMTWNTGDIWSFTTVPEISVDDPSLMLWWTLDEGVGLTAVDWSGHDSHGAITGDAEWALGYQGTAVAFDEDVYVEATAYPGVTGADPRTLCAWVKTDEAFTNMTIMSWGENVTGQKWRMRQDVTGGLRIEVNGGYHYGVTNIGDGNWHHVAVTFEDDGTPNVLDTLLYVDGGLDATLNSQATDVNTAPTGAVRIGESPWHNAPWKGLIDDARVYNKVLTVDELQQVMRGDPLAAWDFQPLNGRTLDIRDVSSLSWRAGDMAAEHDVYLGTDPNAVFAADTDDATGIYRGRQTATTYVPPGGFLWGQTHYWRIDEVNTDGSLTKGGVRTFTVLDYLPVDDFESYNNESPDRLFQTWVDGLGYSADDFYPTGDPGNGTGALVGHDIWTPGTPYTTIVETGIVAAGAQSMPLYYINTDSPFYSAADRTFAPTQVWNAHGVTDLSLWVQGAAAGFLEVAPDHISMSGGGTDIWNTADQFRFAYKTLTGDGSMTARVTGVGAGSNAWAKGGVMIRQSLDDGSVNAMIAVTGGNGEGGTFQWRPTANEASESSRTLSGIAPPYWVRLVREGNTFTGYMSADGENWEQQGTSSIDVEMADPVYIGLGVTSHQAGEMRGYSFDNISTTGNVTGAWRTEDVGVAQDMEGNELADLYLVVTDSSGRSATVQHPDPALVVTPAWDNWVIPLDSLTGVDLGRVRQLRVSVGNPAGATPDGDGIVYVDEIKLIRPAPAEPDDVAIE
jgi:hypothetical protein